MKRKSLRCCVKSCTGLLLALYRYVYKFSSVLGCGRGLPRRSPRHFFVYVEGARVVSLRVQITLRLFMGKSHKKSRSDRVNALRKQYDAFLEEDRRRKARNEYILDRLDKMRYTVSELQPRFKNSIMNIQNVSPLARAESIQTKECFQLIPQANQSLLPINCIASNNAFDDNLLLKEIGKKYILIPKSRNTLFNAQENLDSDNDWKSKYNILDHLKNDEKQDSTSQVLNKKTDDTSENFRSKYELESENYEAKEFNNGKNIKRDPITGYLTNNKEKQHNTSKPSEYLTNDPNFIHRNNNNSSIYEKNKNSYTDNIDRDEITNEDTTNEVIDDDKDTREKEVHLKNENNLFPKESDFNLNKDEPGNNSCNMIPNHTSNMREINDTKLEPIPINNRLLQEKIEVDKLNERIEMQDDIDKNTIPKIKDYKTYEHTNNEILKSKDTAQYEYQHSNEDNKIENCKNNDNGLGAGHFKDKNVDDVSEKQQRNQIEISKDENIENYDRTVAPQHDDSNKTYLGVISTDNYNHNNTEQNGQMDTDQYHPSATQGYEQTTMGQYDETASQQTAYQYNHTSNDQYNPTVPEQYNETVSGPYDQTTAEEYNQANTGPYDQIDSRQYDQTAPEPYDQISVEHYDQKALEQYDQTTSEHYDQTPLEQYDQTDLAQYNQINSEQYDQTAPEQYNEVTSQQYEQTPSAQYEQTPSAQYDQTVSEQYNEVASEQYGQTPSEQYDQTAPEQYEQTPSENYEQTALEDYNHVAQAQYEQESPEQYDQTSSARYDQLASEQYEQTNLEQYEQQSSEQYDQLAADGYDQTTSETNNEENSVQHNVGDDIQNDPQYNGSNPVQSNYPDEYEQNYQEHQLNENKPAESISNEN